MFIKNFSRWAKALFFLSIFFVFSLTAFYGLSTSGDFLCGDVDADEKVTLGDVLYIANYFLKGGPEPVPLDCADVNCDQQVNIGDVIYLANFLLKGGFSPCWAERTVDFEGCKTFERGEADTIPLDQDCIEYGYDGESVLSIKRINAGFNCCPGVIKAFVDIEGDVITIEEKEFYDDTGPCYCLCLFDLDFDITEINPGVYTIKVIELYLSAGDEPLEFSVDLTNSNSGIFCVKRSVYPWMP